MIRIDTSAGGAAPPWLVRQRWENMLFAHWPVHPAQLRRLLPAGVEPDVRERDAWISIVAFVMVETRAPFAPSWSALAPIPELNVRTYVRVGGVPAVWFLSLDATSPLFATMGRTLYGLRYRLARMLVAADGERIHYLSSGAGSFAASYAPASPPRRAEPGSLEHFLVERYRLFSLRQRRLVTAVVAHEPWPLQDAEARIELNTLAPPGVKLPGEPLVHFSQRVDARISAPQLVLTQRSGAAAARPARRGKRAFVLRSRRVCAA